jgi:hypothetical protein
MVKPDDVWQAKPEVIKNARARMIDVDMISKNKVCPKKKVGPHGEIYGF